jgi:hypothetical protein
MSPRKGAFDRLLSNCVLAMQPQNMILTITTGPQAGLSRVVPFGKSICVGRTLDADVPVDSDKYISKKHFEIHHLGDCIELRDLNSCNGTFINGERITTYQLKPGESFKAGRTLFCCAWDHQSENPNREIEREATSNPKYPKQDSEPCHNHPRNGSSNESSAPPTINPQNHFVGQPSAPFDIKPIDSNESISKSNSNNNQILSVGSSFIPSDAQSSEKSNDIQMLGSSIFGGGSVEASGSEFSDRSGQDSLVRLELVLQSDFASTTSRLLQELSRNNTIFSIAHFKKIGMTPPLELGGHPVFRDLSAVRELMPLSIELEDWLRWNNQELINLLAKTDGIMFAILDRDGSYDSIQRVGKQRVQGLSEEGGFLGWCWPFVWESMCEHLNNDEIRDLMGLHLQGIVIPCRKRNMLKAYSLPLLANSFKRCGFS